MLERGNETTVAPGYYSTAKG